MSNLYYNFLANRLVKWLDTREDLNVGDKYFTLFNNNNEAENFYYSLESQEFKGKEFFYSKEFNYKTISLKKGKCNVLFVAPIKGITQDFLVTVRNRVNASVGEWENTAVFFIVYDALDSIIGGAFDASQKDGPFYTKRLYQTVNMEVEAQSKLSFGEKEALKVYIKNISDNSILKDYETIFSILEKGEISVSDFNEMGYFPDNSLDTIPKDVIEARLESNQKMFSRIENLHYFMEPEERLREEFSGEKLIKQLSRVEEWREVEYRDVEKGVQEKDKDKKIELSYDIEKFTDNTIHNWFRLEGVTGTKKKKMHLLMSSVGVDTEEFSFDIFFDNNVSKSDVIAPNTFVYEGHGIEKDNLEVVSKGKKLRVIISDFNKSATYGGLIRMKHKNVNKLIFDIRFMIIPVLLSDLNHLRANFKIDIKKGIKKFYYGISPEVSNYIFGNKPEEEVHVFRLNDLDGKDLKNTQVILEDSVFEEETNGSLLATSNLSGAFFPISFLDVTEKPVPVPALSIERQRLNPNNSQFTYEDNKIITGSNVILVEKRYQERLNIEKQMIEKNSLYGMIVGDHFVDEELLLPENIELAYKKLIEFYLKEKSLPSLAIPSDEHIKLMKDVIDSINDVTKSELIEGEKIESRISNIFYIGMLNDGERFILTPLSPLNIAYQLELLKQLEGTEKIPKENILSTLNPQYLVPYIKLNDKEYQSSYSKSVPRWIFLNKMNDRQLSDLASNVIVQRLDDYITQYKFLFETNNEMALNIAAIQISDETNFFNSIINFLFKRVQEVSALDEINPINIYFDNLGVEINSLFRALYDVKHMDKLNDMLHVPYKTSKFEDYEVLELLKEKINVYKIPENKAIDDLETLFHITFYQFVQRKGISVAKMEKLDKNYAMGGLLSSIQYNKEINSYTNGFGVSEILEENYSDLIDFVYNWNSFVASSNKDTDIYRKGDTLVNNIPQLHQGTITPVLNSSSWVTLLNLDVDLSYFFDESNGEMLVIHYTDQNAMSQYESVTVTNDVIQYERLLKDTLLADLSERKSFDTKEIIRNFNVINGQWLLKLISTKTKKQTNNNILREKLSIISSYKEMLGILKHRHFYWVPISLEEILRVSGMVGLSMKDGLFSAKNLGHSGSTSDDLLFVGIDLRSDKIKLHYLPIEVKVGNNNSSVTEKAFIQVTHTANIIKEFLGEDNPDHFMRDYYRNFFVSIVLANLDKMISSKILPENSEINFTEIKNSLTVGDYIISDELEEYYGSGVVFEFSKKEIARMAALNSSKNVFHIRVPETDAYNIVADKTVEVIANIQNGNFDFKEEILLKYHLNDTQEILGEILNDLRTPDFVDNREENPEFIDSYEMNTVFISPYDSVADPDISPIYSVNEEVPGMFICEEEEAYVISDNESESSVTREVKTATKSVDNLKEKRVMLGSIVDSKHTLFWEYGNGQLANRHLFITGKSGQGKTYFVQTLLAELSHKNINSLVIDYTDGFLPNQLDQKFSSMFEERIVNRYIIQDKLPINPFKLQENDFGGFVIKETDQDMVDRIVQVIDFVFDLGIQQRTLLSETILEGYRMNGESYRFSHLSEDLKTSEDRNKQTLYGRISTLLSRDPFSYEASFDWGEIFGDQGIIHIFQLKGYQLNIQKVLIEFLLWDLFQYATRKGEEGKPLPIILDEVQNLDFTGNSPAVKVLREGRKFGVSGIFATQSLDSIKGNDAEAIYNAAEQLHFLPPESQVTSIARSLTSNQLERKDVELDLKSLLKGEALVYGPVRIDGNNLSEPRINKVKIASFSDRQETYSKDLI